MPYRTIQIRWLPNSAAQWATFTAARLEAGRLWSWLTEYHSEIRREGKDWPVKAGLFVMVKNKYPNLNAQSVQQTVADFCEAVASTEEVRKRGMDREYPFKKPRYRQVIFTNQRARIRGAFLILPCGEAGDLHVRVPKGVSIPGRLMEARLNYGSVDLICKVEKLDRPSGSVVGVDLGVNSVIAATDGEKAVVISGREIKATVQLRNKQLAEIQSAQAGKEEGSRAYKRLQRRKYRMLEKAKNKIRDLCHKATRKVADAFPDAKAYVGRPFNASCRRLGRVSAQTVSVACNAKLISMLDYKLTAAIEVDEHYSSQTCPKCGKRSKHRRIYRCRCGYVAPRDVVGSSNIRAIGIDGRMRPNTPTPVRTHFVHPSKYPGINRVDPRTRGKLLGPVPENPTG